MADRAQGANEVDAGPNNEHSNNDDSEDNGGVQQEDDTMPETEATCDPLIPESQERNGFRDDEDSVEDIILANVNEAGDNESSRLNVQLLENKMAWELAKESGAELYDEEEDIMAALQQQNEEIARKKKDWQNRRQKLDAADPKHKKR
ncbi:uncharacterized protein DS421_2g53980 [Arachis hypogaea]|nr:uncharacterized protein DS421_2g53980 [Arachis hypogaea]